MQPNRCLVTVLATVLTFGISSALAQVPQQRIESLAARLEPQVIAWRHHFHQYPELSNREFETAAKVAEHLRALGMEVQTGVAHTGVVALLKGGKPGPVVALRADMDALPVLEQTGLPYASKVKAQYQGNEVGVMHACGHDAHIAILMGVASVLAELREHIPGTVKFIFQPAEEGAPLGEEGGAALMVKEGVLDEPYAPQAIFGLHVWPTDAGTISYRARGAMAAADEFYVRIKGRQTHGSSPWKGIDPITVAAQLLLAWQTIPSRQLDITLAPAVITVGSIQGGVRSNIIPDEVKMEGTIRTFDRAMREDLLRRFRQTANHIAEAAGASVELDIIPYAPVTYNDPELTEKMRSALVKAVGEQALRDAPVVMGAEDFSHFQARIPGLYVFLGVRPDDVPAENAPANHSPLFRVNDQALKNGVKTLATLALDYLAQQQ